MKKVRFEWSYGGEDVCISGSFNKWSKYKMTKDISKHYIDINIPHGSYTYKFISDGAWVYDIMKPNISDGYGGHNNIITIEQEKPINIEETRTPHIKIKHLQDAFHLDNTTSENAQLTTIYTIKSSNKSTNEIDRVLKEIDETHEKNKIIYLDESIMDDKNMNGWDVQRKLRTSTFLYDTPIKVKIDSYQVTLYGSQYDHRKQKIEDIDSNTSLFVASNITDEVYDKLQDVKPYYCMSDHKKTDIIINWETEGKKVKWYDKTKTIITSRDRLSLRELNPMISELYFKSTDPVNCVK